MLRQAWLVRMHRQATRCGYLMLWATSGLLSFSAFLGRILKVGIQFQWLKRPTVIHVLIRQMYFTGIQSLSWILFLSVSVGLLSIYSLVAFAQTIENLPLIGKLFRDIFVIEMTPILISVFLLARSGVALITEVGHMHLRREHLLLRSLGIGVEEYLYLPRMVAFISCHLILCFVFITLSLWLSTLFISWHGDMSAFRFLAELRQESSLEALLILMLKSFLFSFLSCGVLLYHGSRMLNNPNLLPIHATYGVLGSLMLMIALDVMIGVLLW
ncbi:MAG: ABC transporter permease [Mariprofundaceae bacterium]|nr:ABC transporter permease [Mariprofundaceae bacterium]